MKKILLINDCRFESLVMKDILNDLGYEVSISNEYEAMGEIRDFIPDIIICNLIMKETKGNLLINRIKTMNPEIKCYLSSSNDIKLEDYRRDKVDEVIHTPATREKFQILLQRKSSFCPYCGEKLDKFTKAVLFCPFCGEKL